ncbi:rac-like GTP-binding protein 5-like [Hibiscus syriacus]|uniref:Rac-like GTP-binding protein 5-like n=1 Tax=Hibiscus syriacus TaxID=106335 RepID=A0A6A3BBV2_HIBSY|nr:rac-like GTP-binding protein 5-like [Hibiscus syriacus]
MICLDSTIISMVQRFYDPTSGKILLHGYDLKNLQLKWLREQMGLVGQEPALFDTTIANNTLLGKEDADMEQLILDANAHSFIQELPDTYEKQVGEEGTQLSGESELTVQQALDRIVSNRSTIIVAYRLSTIRDVDTIIVLKNGQVVESGSHMDLMSKNGVCSSNSQNPGKDSSSVAEIGLEKSYQNSTQQRSAPNPSIWELLKLNAPEWPYALLGSVGATPGGMEAPLFSFGITHVLTAFYSPDDVQIKREIERVALFLLV